MSLQSMMRDKVRLIKRDGKTVDNINASVQPNRITTFNTQIAIEEGDTYERALPSGVIERYLILETGYHAGLGGIPASYQSKVRKQTAIDPAPHSAPVYNLIGSNSRVNIHSSDHSVNIVDVESIELFQNLREVAESIDDSGMSHTLCKKIEEMGAAQGKSEFLGKYQEFMALAANHMTVFAPFLPALAQMLR